MASYFRAGSVDVPNGSIELNVTGLQLDFTPGIVQVGVRQPSEDADIVSAYVAGAPTTDGFKVIFTTPVSQTGYKLDWTAFSAGGSQPVDSGTFSADYSVLKDEVAHFLGYDAASLTAAQTAEIDRYIQSGVHQFYYPPMMEGVDVNFEWDFLRQNGAVTTAAGTADYMLPDGFGRMAGQLVFADREARQTIPVIPYGEILRMLNSHPGEVGRPRFSAVMAQNAYGQKGQRKRLYFFPKPDKAYSIQFTCDADTGKIDATTRPFPLGGAMYRELVIESCLAVAEQRANDEVGEHTNNFNRMLVSAIQRGRKATAQVFGRVGDPSAFQW